MGFSTMQVACNAAEDWSMDCLTQQTGHSEVEGLSRDYWTPLVADSEVSRCRNYSGGSCRTS